MTTPADHAAAVWADPVRTLAAGSAGAPATPAEVFAAAVWAYPDRTLMSGGASASFVDSSVTDVLASRRGADLLVTWAGVAPPGSVFQVYLDGRHVWSGAGNRAVLPPPDPGPVRVCVGVVAAANATRDFSGSMPPPPGGGDRVTLTWSGGTYLSDAIAGYRVYLGAAPGVIPDTSGPPTAVVAAYSQGAPSDGFGLGGFGAGGFGRSASTYSWRSGPLARGTWHAAVVPFDTAGTPGPVQSVTRDVQTPPGPPARGPVGTRVAYAYAAGTVTLSWLPSPG